jgi:hypothetical protein
MRVAHTGGLDSGRPQRRRLFGRRTDSVDACAWGAIWSERAVNRVAPNLLDVRDRIATLAIAGDAETSSSLLDRIGRMIGRPFDGLLPLLLLDVNGEQERRDEAPQEPFERLFDLRTALDSSRPVLLFFGVAQDRVTAPRISSLLARLPGVPGLLVMPEPTTSRARDEILACLSKSRLLPLFVNVSGKGQNQPSGFLDTELLARTIHDMFLENAWTRGERLGSTPALQPWRTLDEAYKSPNRAQAEHIIFKLAAVGLIVSPTPTIADGNAEPVWSRADIIESLALMEHDRWASERILAGWTYGETRDERARHHPDLRPYDGLTEDAREKDRVAVSTIPFILHTGGVGWSPLVTVIIAPDWPDPTARHGWRHRWRRDAARVAEERAPAVLEFLADPTRPNHLSVGLLVAWLGFPVSVRIEDSAALSAMLADEEAREPLLQCLQVCRRVVWTESPGRTSDSGIGLTAIATSRHGLRVERSESWS